MKTNVEALKELYIKLGGSLTDTYDDIAGGATVGNLNLIPDLIEACAKQAKKLTDGFVAESRTINGKSLESNVVIGTTDIAYTNEALVGVTDLKGALDAIVAALPAQETQNAES